LEISKRLSKLEQIAPVYAVVVMLLYGWAIGWALWKTPDWITYLSAMDILGIFAYTFAVVFLESLAALSILIALCAVLPQGWFGELFIVRASTLVILLLGYLMYFSYSFETIRARGYPQTLANWTPAVILLIILLVYWAGRVRIIRNVVEEFSSRAVIFLYISIPASFVSIVYVLIRNLFWELIHG
jgi:hypothetical protein